MTKNQPAEQETQVQCLGQGDLLQNELAIRSSIFAWEIHGQRSLVGYSLRGCKRVGRDLMTKQEQIMLLYVPLHLHIKSHTYKHTYIYILKDSFFNVVERKKKIYKNSEVRTFSVTKSSVVNDSVGNRRNQVFVKCT